MKVIKDCRMAFMALEDYAERIRYAGTRPAAVRRPAH